MKHPTKKGGGTLREYRAFGYRVTLETFSERTAKRWQVTAYWQPRGRFQGVPFVRLPIENGDAPAPIVLDTGEGAANLWTPETNGGDAPRLAKAGERVGDHAAGDNLGNAPAPKVAGHLDATSHTGFAL